MSDKLVEFKPNVIFLHRFPGNIQIINFMKF